jgi:hypothetical protein
MRLRYTAGVDPIETMFSRCGTLAEAIRAGLATVPPWVVAEVVVQDEYTHDVIFTPDGTATGDRAIVLDCT